MFLKEHNISVRLPQEKTIDTGIVFVQNDKGVYKLNIRVFDGDYEIDYTEVEEATITFSKADGKVVQGDMQIEADQLTYVLGTNEIAAPGKLLASIQLLGTNERLTTARFLFRVEKDLITEDAVQSTSEFSILQQLKQDLEAIDVVELTNEFNAHTAETATQIALIKDKIGIAPFVKSWEEVQAIVRAGLAEEYFEIGDQFLSMYDGKVIVWTIIGIDHDTPTDSNMTYSLTIQTRDCLTNIQFDAPELTNPDTNRQQYGNNRYFHSAIRQWLNSNDDVFQWSSQHSYDEPPTGSIYEGPGFLKLLDSELAAVIGKVNKQVARNTLTDGGGQDLFSDKVFLLSRVEAGLGTEGTTDGEEVYSYYDGIENAGRIKLLNGSPRYWWLRSPNVSGASSARIVSTSGVVYYNLASISYGLAPACCII